MWDAWQLSTCMSMRRLRRYIKTRQLFLSGRPGYDRESSSANNKHTSLSVNMISLFIFVSLSLSLAPVSRVLGELECSEAADPGPSYVLVSVSPSDSGHLLLTASADKARNTAVCHATCINYIFEGQGSPNGSNATNGTAPNVGSGDPMEIGVGAFIFILSRVRLSELLIMISYR